MRLKLLVQTLIVFSLSVLSATQVIASDVDFSIAPSSLGVLAKPGVSVRVPFTVTNAGDANYVQPVLFRMTESDDGKSFLYDRATSLPLQLSFYEGDERLEKGIELKKGRAKKIIAQIDLTDKISPGDYLLGIGVETKPDYVRSQFNVRITTRVLIPLLLTVSRTGAIDVKGRIQKFEVQNNRYYFDSFDPVPVMLSVSNTGRNASRATGTIVVRNTLGQVLQKPIAERLILPKTSRSLSFSDQPQSRMVLKGFFVGKYTIVASVTLADGTVQLNQTTTFYSFPFKIIGFGIAVTIVGLTILRKQR